MSQRREDATDRVVRVAGSDASPIAVKHARQNCERAGIARRVRLDRCELRDVEPPWRDPGLVVTNPPYGERLGDARELIPLYESLGDLLKQRFGGWTAWVLSGNPGLGKRIGLRPAARH